MSFITQCPFPSLMSGILLSPWEITLFLFSHPLWLRQSDFTSDSRIGHVPQPGQSEHCFPPALVISSNQRHFGSCRGGRLARDRGGAGARRQISEPNAGSSLAWRHKLPLFLVVTQTQKYSLWLKPKGVYFVLICFVFCFILYWFVPFFTCNSKVFTIIELRYHSFIYYSIFLLRGWLLGKKPSSHMVEKETNESFFAGKSPKREGSVYNR